MKKEKQHKVTVYRNYEGTDVYLFPNTLSFEEVFDIVNTLQSKTYHSAATIWNKSAKGIAVRFVLN